MCRHIKRSNSYVENLKISSSFDIHGFCLYCIFCMVSALSISSIQCKNFDDNVKVEQRNEGLDEVLEFQFSVKFWVRFLSYQSEF